MTKRNLGIKGVEKFEKNPFIENALQEIKESTVSKKSYVTATNKEVQQTVVNADNEIKVHTAFLQQVKVDEKKFTKIYCDDISRFYDLSAPASKIFNSILKRLIPNKDYLYFSEEELQIEHNYKNIRSVRGAINELSDKGIVARSITPYKFFINPMLFFNGDRVTFAKSYVKSSSTAEIDPSLPQNQPNKQIESQFEEGHQMTIHEGIEQEKQTKSDQ